MTTLHISNLPESLYTRIKQIAHSRRRTIDEEVVDLLEQAVQLNADRRTQAEILSDIRSRRFTYAPSVKAPDSTTLLREDRER
jgi:plasmid stability protein